MEKSSKAASIGAVAGILVLMRRFAGGEFGISVAPKNGASRQLPWREGEPIPIAGWKTIALRKRGVG